MTSRQRTLNRRLGVLLVASEAAFGHRLAHALHGHHGFRLCGHVLDRTAAPTAVAAEHPDLVVAEIDPHHAGASQFVGQLAAAAPGCRILAALGACDPAEAEQLLRAGVRGLLLKTESAGEILTAFTAVTSGQLYVSRAVTMPLLKRLLRKSSESARGGVDSLTNCELRVFELLGSGLGTRAAAARLGLSSKTVESHREKIKHRLGLKGAAALTQYACAWVQRGL